MSPTMQSGPDTELGLDPLFHAPAPPAEGELAVETHPGPPAAATARPGVGWVHPQCLRYSASRPHRGRSAGPYRARRPLADPRALTPRTVLEYAVFPSLPAGDLAYASTFVAVDLELSDGSMMSDHQLVDQYGTVTGARAQGKSRKLYPDQWNLRRTGLGRLAGRAVVAVHVVVDPETTAEHQVPSGWLDAIALTEADGPDEGHGRPGPDTAAHSPADLVVTTRGTHSGHGYSRGSTFPATCVPRGFNFYTPVTDASSLSWQYSYHADNDETNRPRLQALAVSHLTSRWIGDRATFQFLPWSGDAPPPAAREARALAFGHEAETARPHLYRVRCDDGTVIAMAPGSHSMAAEFTFPSESMTILFDNITGDASLDLTRAETAGVVTGWSDVRSAMSEGATRMFVWANVDTPVAGSGLVDTPDRPGVSGYVRLTPRPDRTVTLRLATSFISLAQARRNLDAEITPEDSVTDVAERARATWNAELSHVTVDGATPDQLTTLYSGLYRLLCYPNIHSEPGPSPDGPERYASPVSPAADATDDQTGARVVAGRLYVNNGFWDTYRTCWPAYTLLRPSVAAELIDGFVQHYVDGGWMPRWSSPGYVDCMVGTSSDVVIADALAKDVTGFDVTTAYDASLRNATVPAARAEVGRQGLATAMFRGYVSTETPEGLSWSLESAVNDFGLMVQSAQLAASCDPDDPRRDEYRANERYFADRALAYTRLFDDATGFFRGRDAAGAWRADPPFDPRRWGYDYTETNAWNMAFTVPHDPPGLVALHGGPAALEARLDTFFRTPETGSEDLRGSYDAVIHEMTEARDVRLGMFGMSNQPSHHIPFMYVAAGRPDKSQAIVRDVLDRLFVGSDIGQGYLGDEDNGEMSAWYFFAALGLYPVSVGSPYYVISSPLFRRMTVILENGRDLVVEAPANSPENVYVQSVSIDGEPWADCFVTHQRLTQGATIVVDLGPEPSDWGAGRGLPGLTTPGMRPAPLDDRSADAVRVLSSGCRDAHRAFDDTAWGAARIDDGGWLGFESAEPLTCDYYTVTASDLGRLPAGWELEGSDDGRSWIVLDRRRAPAFRWDHQVRAFLVESPRPCRFHRLVVHSDDGASIAQLEVYG